MTHTHKTQNRKVNYNARPISPICPGRGPGRALSSSSTKPAGGVAVCTILPCGSGGGTGSACTSSAVQLPLLPLLLLAVVVEVLVPLSALPPSTSMLSPLKRLSPLSLRTELVRLDPSCALVVIAVVTVPVVVVISLSHPISSDNPAELRLRLRLRLRPLSTSRPGLLPPPVASRPILLLSLPILEPPATVVSAAVLYTLESMKLW